MFRSGHLEKFISVTHDMENTMKPGVTNSNNKTLSHQIVQFNGKLISLVS